MFISNQNVISQNNDTMKMRQQKPNKVQSMKMGNEMEEVAHPLLLSHGSP